MPGKSRDQKFKLPSAELEIDKDLKLPVYVMSIAVVICWMFPDPRYYDYCSG